MKRDTVCDVLQNNACVIRDIRICIRNTSNTINTVIVLLFVAANGKRVAIHTERTVLIS
jgi:hypothetical protein